MGVKERLKTGITGVRYEEGKAVAVTDPGLELDTTLNGETVPFSGHIWFWAGQIGFVGKRVKVGVPGQGGVGLTLNA